MYNYLFVSITKIMSFLSIFIVIVYQSLSSFNQSLINPMNIEFTGIIINLACKPNMCFFLTCVFVTKAMPFSN